MGTARGPRIGIISDDLTGANGVAAMFAARGMPARTLLGTSLSAARDFDTGVLVVDTATREASPVDAAAAASVAVSLLRTWRADSIAQRIDTTLRGNIGAELRALLDALDPRPLAIVVPAAPESGRVAVDGRIVVHGQPLSELTGAPDRPLPVIAAHLGGEVIPLDLETVRRGVMAVAHAITRAARTGVRALVCDAATTADIDVVARAVAVSGMDIVSVDPGGFTLALMAARGRLTPAPALGAAPIRRTREHGPPTANTVDARSRGDTRPMPRLLALCGSRTAIAAEQISTAAAGGYLTVIDLDGPAIMRGGAVAAAEVERVVTLAGAEGTSVIGVRVPDTVGDDARQPEGADHTGARHTDATVVGSGAGRVAAALAAVAAGALSGSRPPVGLYLSGGAVARATLDRLGARAVAVDGEILPLAAAGRLVGGPHAGLRIVTKGGMIGDANAIAVCLCHLRASVAGIRD